MNHIQVETIFLNLIRQTEEFLTAIVGNMPDSDSGSFYTRLITLFDVFKNNKVSFTASSYRLGQVATLLKEYAAFTKQPIDSIDSPEILTPVLEWENIENKPEFFTPYAHFHKWEEITYKPIKFLPVTHRHPWNDLDSIPATFPPSEHTHPSQAAQAVAWNDVTEKPTTFTPAEHTHPAQSVAWADVTEKPTTFEPAAHTHENLDDLSYNVRGLLGNELLVGTIALMPSDLLSSSAYWYGCDGYAIERRLPAGQMLVNAGCPFGGGDGIDTVNLPDYSAETTPPGSVYCLYVGFAP